MTLLEVISQLNRFHPDGIIYAKKGRTWDTDSPAMVLAPEEATSTFNGDGFRYFLEISIALEVLEVWSSWRDGVQPTVEQKFEAVVYYAENDAYIG